MCIAFLADIHGNHFALEKVLNEIPLSYDIYVLGDTLGYLPFYKQCVKALIERNATCIEGNHEHMLLKTKGSYTTNELLIKYHEYFDLSKNDEILFWLQTLQKEVYLTINNQKCMITHASPWSIDEYIYKDSDNHHRFLDFDSDVFFIGHNHVQFKVDIANKSIYSIGSVGLPRRGPCRANYLVFEDNKFKFKTLSYNPSPLFKMCEPFNESISLNSVLKKLDN
ncbi:metallophosphoesterase [Desulfovibrio sp. UCD-KL4C]|uniref:metallophosphoesterase family protein n=1 Tax=Desulfovibrio sp. UCD-KL4C TaxID=2578120 RepID=UPI0025BA4728|nr:metallophosphoesterase family protein [Desulfovibrio sp. UCD-KL4C]